MEPDQILADLIGLEPGYRREAVDAAIEQHETTTPFVLRLLDEVLDDPQTFVDTESPFVLYAIALLSHLQVSEAHRRLVALSRLNPAQLDALIGDAIVEILPIALWRTCDGNLDGLTEILNDAQADLYVRMGAASVLVYAAAQGMASREAVMAQILAQLDAEDPATANTELIHELLPLVPVEHEQHLRNLFERGLVDPVHITVAEFEDLMAIDLPDALELAREDFERRVPTDIHGYIAHWYGFADGSTNNAVSNPRSGKKMRKVKRKAAAKARKKNRKKK